MLGFRARVSGHGGILCGRWKHFSTVRLLGTWRLPHGVRPVKVGQTFGQLKTVLPVSADTWLCFCDCGESVTVPTSDLEGGHIRSCGCQREPRLLQPGMTVGQLTVVAHRQDDAWECRCTCGRTINVLAYNLRTAASQSCGACRRAA